MGSVCCVSAREKTIPSAPSSQYFHRNNRHSPTWSFRWENRGRVAGEEDSMGQLPNEISCGSGSDSKCEIICASEDRSSLDHDNFPRQTWTKSPLSEGNFGHAGYPPSAQPMSRNISMDANLEQVDVKESPLISPSSPVELSFSSLCPTSSITESPLSSQVDMQPSSSSTSMCMEKSPKWQVNVGSNYKAPGLTLMNSQLNTEGNPGLGSRVGNWDRAFHCGPSDFLSANAFSGFMPFSNGSNLASDGDSISTNFSKPSNQVATCTSSEGQVCGICSKLLSEKSPWSGQKIVANNEPPIVAILICGHAFHASMTPEIDKYDPSCPVCTFGEKQTLKMSEKVLEAELDRRLKKGKRWRNQVMDIGFGVGYSSSGHSKIGGWKERGLNITSNSSKIISLFNPFPRGHFSFESKGNMSLSKNTTSKKDFFW
ncbi:hypothetical protein SAY87_014366 [Trapa incisa]|uniref:RING-type domain-containing protein n=1 Tax=Trapa incisa TaxID=236973 RepID=A0AAN7GWN5_9MYRT|nr:hypothetical protein SAY87_014366 [Trapa incisa]